jgi:hypothetical protein
MITLAEYDPSQEQGQCDGCGMTLAAFALTRCEGETGWQCGHCRLDAAREAQIAAEAAAPAPEGWASDTGVWLKSERSRRLDAMRWTVMPDSPLSAECQAAWLGWLRALQRMTRDCPDPADWRWPVEPLFTYQEN